jgi:hypothetical protein
MRVLLLIFAWLLLSTGCEVTLDLTVDAPDGSFPSLPDLSFLDDDDNGSDSGCGDADTDADTDSDADMDTDADTDVDGDTDADTDNDTGPDAGEDSGPDTGMDPPTPDAGQDSGTEDETLCEDSCKLYDELDCNYPAGFFDDYPVDLCIEACLRVSEEYPAYIECFLEFEADDCEGFEAAEVCEDEYTNPST